MVGYTLKEGEGLLDGWLHIEQVYWMAGSIEEGQIYWIIGSILKEGTALLDGWLHIEGRDRFTGWLATHWRKGHVN